MTNEERVSLYSEILFGCYAFIGIVMMYHYVDVPLPQNEYQNCDIIHEARVSKDRCGYFDEEVTPLEY